MRHALFSALKDTARHIDNTVASFGKAGSKKKTNPKPATAEYPLTHSVWLTEQLPSKPGS